MRPNVYAHNFADSNLQNEWSKLINKEWSDEDGQLVRLTSLDGVEFQSFSKSPLNEIEIYEDKIAIELKESFNVEVFFFSNFSNFFILYSFNVFFLDLARWIR